MLRKRNRSTQKELQMGQATMDAGSDGCLQSGVMGQKQRTSSFFNVPGLLIGLTPKGVSDCDSVRSPTSPLDFKLFSNLGSAFRSPRCSHEGHQKSWDCSKLGLGIVDSLHDDDDGKVFGNVVRSTNSKSIVFGPQIRAKSRNSLTQFCSSLTPKSLPKSFAIFPHTQLKSPRLQKGSSDVLFEIGEDPLEPYPFAEVRSFSLDSKSLGSHGYGLADRRSHSGSSRSSGLGKTSAQEDSTSRFSGKCPNSVDISQHKLRTPVVVGFSNGFVGKLSPSEIELSEDYTRVISHGPNPKTTHIYGDFILECHAGEHDSRKMRSGGGLPELEKCSRFPASYPSDEFLSFCFFCNKKLEEGEDIYMFSVEKAFCSSDCRLEEISLQEGKDKAVGEAPKALTSLRDHDDILRAACLSLYRDNLDHDPATDDVND
ncbi:FCS-Like Zinc finger 11-like protein [Drosera capensis]